MYRLPGRYPDQSEEQQDQARANLQGSGPFKGKPAGRTCRRRGGDNHRPQLIWEASDLRKA